MSAQKTVADLMTKKVVSFFEEQSLPLAHELMKLRKMRHIPVIDEERRVVGVVTHRDIMGAQSQAFSLMHDRASTSFEPTIAIQKIMSRDVWTVNQSASAYDAGKLLLDHTFSCLPVVDDGHRLVGIVTDRDYLKFALSILE